MKNKLLKNLSITNYFWAFIIFLFFAVTIAYFWMVLHYSINKSVSILKTQSSRIEKSFSDSADYTLYLMNYLNSQIKNNPSDLERINELLSSFRLNQDVNNKIPWNMFSWVNKDLKLVVNSDKGVVSPIDISERDYLKAAILNPSEMHFGKIVYGKVSKALIIPAGMAAFDNGEYIGAMVFGFRIDKLIFKLNDSLNANGVNFAFFDKNSEMIFSSSNFVNDNNISENFRKIDKKNSSGVLTTPSVIFGNYTLSYYHIFDKYPYVIVVQYDQNLLKKDLLSKIIPYLFELSLILLILFIIIFIFKRMIINPILKLSSISKMISSNSEVEINVFKSIIPEINQLSKSIISIRDFVQSEQFLKEELNVANLHLKSLTESISHDMRNYISGIIGLANIIYDLESKDDNSVIDKENNKKNVIKYAGMIRSQASHMLEFSRALISEGVEERIRHQKSTDVNKKNIDIGELLEELVFLNQPFIKTHNVCVNLDVEKNIPPIFANLIELRKILDNLITNAAKYSNEGGKINIKVEKFLNEEKKEAKADLLSTFKLSLKYKICVEISDQGIGMTEEEIEKALSGGGRKIDKTDLNKEIDSHGLGLPIVDKAVSNMGATMKIESKKGFGTTIKIWFEVVLNRDQASQNQELIDNKKIDISDIGGSGQDISSNYNDANSPTILIADDDQLIRSLTVHQLRNLGLKSIAVQNGVEAIKILDKQHFDLVLMDTNMEELNDGVKIVKIIREGSIFKNFKDFKTIPIIALSANIDRASKDVALISGMDDYLEKPLNQDKFLDIIRKYGFKSSISEKDSESSKD
ncbi:MAG: signal transduction histidine kinase/FixJ family two-component response regulator [Rickettsiales bacterium]|jgi:signal transduction histidine kinase/FixJ family two-component response regulator